MTTQTCLDEIIAICNALTEDEKIDYLKSFGYTIEDVTVKEFYGVMKWKMAYLDIEEFKQTSTKEMVNGLPHGILMNKYKLQLQFLTHFMRSTVNLILKKS